MELLTRFLTCPSKKVFVRSLHNIIDLVALISFYADLTIFILGVLVYLYFTVSKFECLDKKNFTLNFMMEIIKY